MGPDVFLRGLRRPGHGRDGGRSARRGAPAPEIWRELASEVWSRAVERTRIGRLPEAVRRSWPGPAGRANTTAPARWGTGACSQSISLSPRRPEHNKSGPNSLVVLGVAATGRG